jgi:hypothetical protein
MKRKFTAKASLAFLKTAIGFFLLLALFSLSCRHKLFQSPIAVSVSPCNSGSLSTDTLVWADYNILFKPGSTQHDINKYLEGLDQYLCGALSQRYSGPRRIYHTSCPCGPLFVNVKVVVDASGGSVTGNPPPTPPPGVSGGSVQFFANNVKVDIPELGQGIRADTSYRYHVDGANKSIGNTTIAIVDAGLDLKMYNTSSGNLGQWLWKDPTPGATTISNFLGGNPADFMDNTTERHGTIVTAMVLDMFRDTAVFPKLMILKALDNHGSGTIFSITCAMSYAICHKATVINASFGYYGAPDPALLQCVLNSENAGIPVIAAAGNVRPPHDNSLFCSQANFPGNLGSNNLFYPACFTDTMNVQNMISVTNVRNQNNEPNGACFYQNYSSTYVSVGVMNENGRECCEYQRIPFLLGTSATAEGSSFATPVVTGMIDRFIEGGSTLGTGNQWLQNHSKQAGSLQRCTINGQYVTYSGNF